MTDDAAPEVVDDYHGEWTIICVRIPAGRDNDLFDPIAQAVYTADLPTDPFVYSHTFASEGLMDAYEYRDAAPSVSPSPHLVGPDQASKEDTT